MFGQSRRDEISIATGTTDEFSQPIYGRQSGDVAPKGALGSTSSPVLQIFRPYGPS